MGISTTQRTEVSAVTPSTPTFEASLAGGMPPTPSTPTEVAVGPSPPGGGVIERNILGLLSSQVATWLITLVSLVVVPRRLGAQDVGRLGFATAFVAFFTLIGLLGTNTFLVKTVARDRSKVGPYVLNTLVMKLYLCGILSAVAIALAYVLGPVFDYGQETKVLIAVMCIGMTFAVLNDALLAGLQGMERMARAAGWAAIGHYVGTGLGLLVVLTSRSLFSYAFALTLISVVPAFANAYAMWPHLRHAGPIRLDLWRQIARGGLPFLVWASFLLIYGTIDIPLLQALSNEETVGWYTTAYRWVSTPVFIASVVLTAFLPSLSTDAHNNPAKFAARTNGALRVVFMVTAPLAIGAALVAGDAISLAYESDFQRAVPVLQILAIHIPFAAMSMVLGMALIASDRQKRWVIVGRARRPDEPVVQPGGYPLRRADIPERRHRRRRDHRRHRAADDRWGALPAPPGHPGPRHRVVHTQVRRGRRARWCPQSSSPTRSLRSRPTSARDSWWRSSVSAPKSPSGSSFTSWLPSPCGLFSRRRARLRTSCARRTAPTPDKATKKRGVTMPDTPLHGSKHLSAVICTRNRPDKIGNAVASVLANDHTDFDLTVIDQSTTDATERCWPRSRPADPRLRYIHTAEAGLSRAYNTGVRRTTGDVIAFTDDDCVVPTDWLTSVANAFAAEPDGDLLYGRVVPLGSGNDDAVLTPLPRHPEARSAEPGRRVQGLRHGRQLRRPSPAVRFDRTVRRGARRRRPVALVAGLRPRLPHLPGGPRHSAAPRGDAAPRRAPGARGLGVTAAQLRHRRRRVLFEARAVRRPIRPVAADPASSSTRGAGGS